MDEITNAKNEFRLRQWLEVIKRCQASGMTVKTWCEENNISIKSYYYRLRKLRTQTCNNEMVPVQKGHQAIVPVTYKNENQSKSVTINTGNISIDIYEGATKTTLENLLNILGIIC